MAQIDIERVIQSIKEGDETYVRSVLGDANTNLRDTKRFGLQWEHGGTSQNSPFPAENVVLQVNDNVPVPRYERELSYVDTVVGGGQHTN